MVEMYSQPFPTRVRVLILGGGIHGVGVLHDLVSRGWVDCHLLEKHLVGSGTSSKSTKLIHGGLRYLKHIGDYPMVRESLRERRVLMDMAGDLVHPIEICLPVLRSTKMPAWMVRAGLTMYDWLAGSQRLGAHRTITPDELRSRVPIVDTSEIASAFSFWDAQTDDLALVERVAASAKALGGGINEGVRACKIAATADGWEVTVRDRSDREAKISALYVVNCLGPWAHEFLDASQVDHQHVAVNNKGVHLVLPDFGLSAGLLLQSAGDSRIFFVLPWLGKTLLGTTEELYQGDLDRITTSEQEVEYLLNGCNRYLTKTISTSDIEGAFAGLRWLAVDGRKDSNGQLDISATSREFVLAETLNTRGMLITLYGGKLTSYRSLAEKIGSRITNHFGERRASRTHLRESWTDSSDAIRATPSVIERFSDRPVNL